MEYFHSSLNPVLIWKAMDQVGEGRSGGAALFGGNNGGEFGLDHRSNGVCGGGQVGALASAQGAQDVAHGDLVEWACGGEAGVGTVGFGDQLGLGETLEDRRGEAGRDGQFAGE